MTPNRLLHIQTLLLAFLLVITPAGFLMAQDGQMRIVAIVNDEIVTLRDLNERVKLVFATTGIPDLPETRRSIRDQVLRAIIDERLFLQEAKKRNVSISQEEVDRTIAVLERQMNIPPGRFEEFMARANVDPAAVTSQIRAEQIRIRLVRGRFSALSTITDPEVDAAVEKLKASAGQIEDLLAEIVVPVDNPDQEETARALAARLVQQVKDGANFPALARQFSRGATAANGGDMGWVARGSLEDEIDAAIASLERGAISNPVRSLGGYYILLLRDRRRIAQASPEEVKITLKQVLLPVPQNSSPRDTQSLTALATSVRDAITGCDDVEPLAAELKAPGSGSLGTVRLADLPENFRAAVADLKPGQTSQPVATPRAVHLFTICAREEPKSGIDRDAVRQNILVQRLQLLNQRYLQDLRRDATIEFR